VACRHQHHGIYRGVMPLLLAMIVLLGILMLVPEIALFLPPTMK
jgi:hypothetical protein